MVFIEVVEVLIGTGARSDVEIGAGLVLVGLLVGDGFKDPSTNDGCRNKLLLKLEWGVWNPFNFFSATKIIMIDYYDCYNNKKWWYLFYQVPLHFLVKDSSMVL